MSLHWSTHQLTEYFAAISSAEDEPGAVRVAIERAAETLDAEVGAVVSGGQVADCVGMGQAPPPPALVTVTPGTAMLLVPGLGELHAAAGELAAPGEAAANRPAGTPDAGRAVAGMLVVARVEEAFGPEEEQLLQGMARVLGLVLRNLRALAAERSRHQLLERLLSIQRAISHRKPLQEVLDAVTESTSGLLGSATVSLVLADPLASERLLVASRYGPGGGAAEADRDEQALGAAAAAMARGQLVPAGGHSDPQLPGVIAAPVHEHAKIVGSLVAHTADDGDHGAEQAELLAAFAQQVSLALTDARTLEKMLEAHHDSLTGLANRGLFLDRLGHARTVVRRRGDELTVLFIDLDRFKAVNDSLGHQAGDELLASVARRLQGCLRSCDTASRLGGDEFAVLLEGTGVEEALPVARRIIDAVSLPYRVAGREVCVGASIGVAADRGEGDAADLLSNADVAMYRAKRSGSGRVSVFEPQMHREAMERLNLQSHLQRGIAHEEFWLQYQPLVRLDTGVPVGVEALMRWTHPRHGMVPPGVFIPLAEESDTILELGRWVLWHAARQVFRWREELPELCLNVNVSPRQVVDPRFGQDVADVLSATALPPEALTLELTESLLMADPATVAGRLSALRDLGVHLSVDDFGTGFSSLAYLRRFPVDQVKIDRSFVEGIGADPQGEDLAVVRTIVELGRVLRLVTVAEGIETQDQLEALAQLGCDLGQGFLIARPAAADAVLDCLRSPPALRPFLGRVSTAV